MTAAVLVAADEPPVEPGQPYVSPDDLASITPLWQQAVAQTLIPVVAEAFHASAGVVHARMVDATQVPTLPSIGSLAAEQYLAQAANTFAEVGDSLWATARAELLDGFEKGESIPQLAARLRASAGMTAKRATLVARTQVLDASNAGSIATARATGLDLRKGWLDTPDQRTRPTHHQAGNTYGSDQGMIPLGDQFTVGGYQCDRPHDPTLPPAERYNCRCTVIYSMVDAAVDDAVRGAEPVPPIPGTSGIEPPPDPYAGDLVNPALPGPDTIPDLPAGVPITVRPTLEAARTTSAVSRVFGEEYQRITGRPPGYIDFQGSAATAREHAEGLLQGLERFPDARLDRVGPYSIKADSVEYAHRTGSRIEFNYHWTQPAARRRYLSALQSDVDSRWHPTGTGHPAGIALHEFGHVLDTRDIYPELDQLLARTAAVRDAELAARRAAGELVDPKDFVAGSGVDGLIRREVSRYATTNRTELVAEAFADVMVNGDRASALSKQIFTLLEAQYRRGGGTVRAVSREAALAVPSPTSALAARTVPQLRALAKERGITIPTGSKKADIVRLLDEGAPSRTAGIPKYEPPASLTAAERDRASRLVRADQQIYATVRERFDPISTSGNLSISDAAWLQSIYKREPAFVERLAQTAQIERNLRDKARKAGQSLAEYRKETAARLKGIVDEKPLVVRVTDDRALARILDDGRFKTQFDTGIRRAPGLEVGVERRRLGEQILGISPDVPADQRPVYGFVAIRGVEPALEAGRKIPGIAQFEGQEDILSAYGKVQVVLKPTVRSRTTITVGDSLDEIGFVRPSSMDSPLAESAGVRNLDRVTEPGWTRTGYVEAQIHGGVRVDDIEMVVFAQDPSAALAGELRARGIRYQVLGRDDQPIFPSAAPSPPPLPVPAVEVPLAKRTVAQLRALAADRKITIPAGARKPDIVRLLEAPPLTQAEERAAARAAARETNRLIEESTANAQVLAEVDALLAKKASAATIREALDAALVEPGQLFAGADPAMLAALRAVAGDPVKLRAAVTRLGGKIKVKPVSKAGAKVVFDADTMEGVGGIDIPAGAKVTVVRRGSTVTLPDGTVMQLEKARVTPVAAPAKKAAPVKRTPAPKASPSRRQPGRDLLSTSTAKAEPVEVLKAAAQRDAWVDRAAAEQRFGDPVIKVLTTAVRQQDGWSTPARVVTPAQLDRLADSGWTEMWRGVEANHTGVPSISATDIARATRTGDWQMTKGIYGNGVYTTARRTTAEMYRGGTIPDFDFRRGIPAESFGPAPMYEYLPGLTPSPQGSGGLMRMVLDPDAKIVDYEDLRAEHREFLSSEAYHSMPYGSFKRELGDSSFYAVMRGYDGIRVHGPRHNDGAIYPEGVTNRDEPPQWVIFNRSVLVFERASKRYDT